MNQAIAQPLSAELRSAQAVFEKQKDAYFSKPYLSYEERLNNLNKLDALIRDNIDAIAAAIDQDYGGRSTQESKFLEVFSSLDGIKYIRKKLKTWMKPEKRHVSFLFLGGKNTVLAQPKGVVGVIVPWNYPLFLAISPISYALAAGNRVMVKMAKNSQNLCRLLNELSSATFDDDTLAFMPGVAASEFTPLPFDHLIFTGSPESGKVVMKTAAENLTPVTLELGGKSPTLICDDYDINKAVDRITFTKFLNAGQTCVAPDYVLVPRNKLDAFVSRAREAVARRYPNLDSSDFTSVVDKKSYDRLSHWLSDAESKGASIETLIPNCSANPETNKIPPTLVVNVDVNMQIMQDEIFGPLLAVMPYDNVHDALAFINRRERPLALYLFTNNSDTQDLVVKNTLSGGVCLNDCMYHVAQHDMPFGGVGNSGMGHYHGKEGFLEFSKLRPIFKQAAITMNKDLEPPYGSKFDFIFNFILKLSK